VEAIASFQEAIRLEPALHRAHLHLGLCLARQKKLDEAVVAYRQAIRLKPDYHRAHFSLGTALFEQRKLPEAVIAYRATIRLQPEDAEAHCNLGQVLQLQGKFVESLVVYRRGHQLGLKTPGWRYPSAVWVRQAHRLVELDGKLEGFLKGDRKPKDASEQLELAALCAVKGWYAATARFYADAFAARSTLPTSTATRHRYTAACAAILAGCGQGKDPVRPDDKERTRLRMQAFTWLRAELTRWRTLYYKGDPRINASIEEQLQNWQSNPNLAGVRDRAFLDQMPEAERTQWQKLWASVKTLRKSARASK
jgi:Tfp pilus assembly protein PilF